LRHGLAPHPDRSAEFTVKRSPAMGGGPAGSGGDPTEPGRTRQSRHDGVPAWVRRIKCRPGQGTDGVPRPDTGNGQV